MKTDRITRRDLLSTAVLAPLALSAKGAAVARASSGKDVKQPGSSVDELVPDTLDLSHRAALGLNALTGTLDPQVLYEMYFLVMFAANPPYMKHETTGLPTNNPKYAESFPMMRLMTGSEQSLDIERGMMQAMVSLIGKDGLYYSPMVSNRPWSQNLIPGGKGPGQAAESFANVYGNSRALLAFLAWMQYEPKGGWEERAAGIARGLSRIAVRKENYAYYPDNQVGEGFSYPISGWRNTDEPAVEGMGAEGSMFMYLCGPIRALTHWYRTSGDPEALETATRLVRFVTKRRFWGISGTPKDISAAEHAYFTGHMHGHTAMLFALIEYAIAAENSELMNFVRDGYEFARHHGITRLGAWLNEQPNIETCTLSDMVAIAIKLTEAGMGDYYEDVDQVVRNQLVESQLVRADFLREISRAAPSHALQEPQETSDRVIERALGVFSALEVGGYGDLPGRKRLGAIGCCTGNGTQALYYAWSKIIESRGDAVQINLLLNRTSPQMDIDSYLPNEGKIVLHNKTAKTAYVRIPHFVDRESVKVLGQRDRLDVYWVNRYAVISNIKPGERIQVSFPMKEESASYTFLGEPYACYFRGNTVVSISPRVSLPAGYPIYLRDQDRQERAPMVTRPRYVAPRLIDW